MSRKWQPGDVAIGSVNGAKPVQMVRTTNSGEWALSRKVGNGNAHASGFANGARDEVTDIRPLVVIDPEDREQVKTFMRALWDADKDLFGKRSVAQWVPLLTNALCEFADPKPPKPEEPTGLGAVVEDAGRRWIHFGNHCWIKDVPNANFQTRSWEQFDNAVKVLSEGVTS